MAEQQFTLENLNVIAEGPDGQLWQSIAWCEHPTVVLRRLEDGKTLTITPGSLQARQWSEVENLQSKLVDLVGFLREDKTTTKPRSPKELCNLLNRAAAALGTRVGTGDVDVGPLIEDLTHEALAIRKTILKDEE